MKKLPLLIKILVAIFLIETVRFMLGLSKIIKLGFGEHILLYLILFILFLSATIGLFKLKKWGRKCCIPCIVIEAISFSIYFFRSFIESFAKSSKMQNIGPTATLNLSIGLGLLMAGVVIYYLIRYLYQEKISNLFS